MATSSPTRHVNVDRTHKLIRRYAVTDAAVHDSRKLNGLLQFGDSAYRSAANEGRGFRSRIHVRAARSHPLSKAKATANRAKSRNRGAHRACVRRIGDCAGGPAGAHDRHRTGADQDRNAELRLQCSPAGDARTQEVPRIIERGEPTGRRVRVESACRRENQATDGQQRRRNPKRRPPASDHL